VVSQGAQSEAHKRYNRLSVNVLWERAVETLSSRRYLQKNEAIQVVQSASLESSDALLLQDSYVWSQGPNYAFAKLIQRWRAMVAMDNGHIVSSNIGPATVTESVVHNRLVAAGMYGCSYFGIDAFEPPTTAALMTLLLIYDVHRGGVHRGNDVSMSSPLQLSSSQAIHGGTWRAAFKTNSYTEVSAVLYLMGKARPFLLTAGTLLTLRRFLHSQRGAARL